MKRYKRDKLKVVVFGPQGERHEQIIDVNLYKNVNHDVIVNFEGQWHTVVYSNEINAWTFADYDEPKKPEPKTIEERVNKLTDKVDAYLNQNQGTNDRSTINDLIKETLGIIKDVNKSKR